MKNIGYIYKYSNQEKKGIIVYGKWIKNGNVPFLFSEIDCITKVKTGQLAYFELNEGKIENIERASLANFDKQLMLDLLAHKSTIIFYENLNDILEFNSEKFENFSNEVIHDEDYDEYIYLSSPSICSERYINRDETYYYDPVQLPTTINDLYKCFGKYKHSPCFDIFDDYSCNDLYDGISGKESLSVSILDFSLWFDKKVSSKMCFGEKREDFEFLYDVFIKDKGQKQKTIKTPIGIQKENRCSSSWKLLLAKISENELKSIIRDIPLLQPLLPADFCKRNPGLLTTLYGMPNVTICKLYCLDRIEKIYTVSEYIEFSQELNAFEHCEIKNHNEEGVPMCKMGKRNIKRFGNLLNERFENVVKSNIIHQYISYTSKHAGKFLISKAYNKNQFLCIGIFMEDLMAIDENKCHFYKFMEDYKSIPPKCKISLKNKIRKSIYKVLIKEAKDLVTGPDDLNSSIEVLSEWIDDKTKSEILNIANSRFANSNNFTDLYKAYKYGFITHLQYIRKYRFLTSDMNAHQLVINLNNSINWCFEKPPLSIQWYIISRIIKLSNYKSLESNNWIFTDGYDKIFDIRSLLQWIRKGYVFNYMIIEKAEKCLLSILNDDEIWTLFTEGMIVSPGERNIRKHLNKAYRNQSLDAKVFKKDCLQYVMYKDLQNCTKPYLMALIVDHLNKYYQDLLLEQSEGFLKLYLWLKKPDENYNWLLITSHFHELSIEDQFKLFRFLFFLLATKNIFFTISELFNIFVNSSNKVCPPLCALILILKEKFYHPYLPITSDDFKTYNVKIDDISIEISDFFYPCYGSYILSYDEYSVKYRGIIEKKEIGGELCYVISFFQQCYCLCENFESSYVNNLYDDDFLINQAKSILLTNFNVKIIDGKYILPLTEEIRIKNYVMNYKILDKCCLFKSQYNLFRNRDNHNYLDSLVLRVLV